MPLIRRLLDGDRVTHAGRFYAMEDAVCEPRPMQARLPILIGGSGPRKTLPLVARYADMWNAYGTPETLAASDLVLRDACAAIGRDEREIERSTTLNLVIRSSRAEADAAWSGWCDIHLPKREQLDVGGSPAEVAAALVPYRAAGFETRRLRVQEPVRPRDHGPAGGGPCPARRLESELTATSASRGSPIRAR